MKTPHKVIIAVVVCIIGFLGFRYIYDRMNPDLNGFEIGPKPVEATFAVIGDLDRKAKITGTLVATQSVAIRPEVQGRIKEVLFKEGQEVNKDDPLYKIEDGAYVAAVKKAEAQVSLSRIEYNRQESLLKKDFGTTQKRDQALAALRVHEAELDEAQLRLDHTTIRAPFDGVMSFSEVDVGTFVSESVEVTTIVDLDPIEVEFTVPEKFIGAFKKGDIVDVTVEGYDILPYEATVDVIDPKVDIATRTVRVSAVMKNPELALRPGQFARVLLDLGIAKDAIIIPETAILRDNEEEYVYVIEGGRALRKIVDVGARDGTNAEILGGLKEGEQVVTEGGFRVVQDGEIVTVVDEVEDATEPATPDLPVEAPSTDEEAESDSETNEQEE